MRRRIFRYMGLLILFTVLLLTCLYGLFFSGLLGTQVKEGLDTLRVSIIDGSGVVVFDNRADPASLESHADRPEVAAALENGHGESERFSSTLGEITYYDAARLPDGQVLRLAFTSGHVAKMLLAFVPLVLVSLMLSAFLAFIVARRLTKRIIAPINSINLERPELFDYDELLPLLKRIEAQRRELAAQLAQLESRTATITAITGSMREGLLLLDGAGIVALANESALGILSLKEAVGKSMAEVCRHRGFLERARSCLGGEKAEMVLQLHDRSYSAYFNPVLEGHGAVVLLVDSTERHAAEVQRKAFSANVSHELKTPLTTIAGLSELLSDGTAGEGDTRAFAAKIRSQTKRLIAIIDDIIRLSEFDEGAVPRAFVPCDLNSLAQGVVESLRESARQHGVAVALQEEGGISIMGSPRMLDELLYNLIDNAIKYNREGGSVWVALAAWKTGAAITVTDTGIGIPAPHTQRVFERFYRVDKSRSKKTGGTGLGLAIVKHIAELHGGTVSLESTEGTGTVVTVTLPGTCAFKATPV